MIDVFKNPELNYNSNLLGRSSSIVIAEHGYTRQPAAAGAGDQALRYARVTTKAVAALQFNRTIY